MTAFAITGEYTGMTIATGADRDRAVRYAMENGFIGYGRGEYAAAAALDALAVGGAWKSHEDARGIKITRTS